MIDQQFYASLSDKALAGEALDEATCKKILTDKDIELLPLLDAAYRVRKTYHGKDVNIHILNNAENGHCPEDCNYCAQAKTSEAGIDDYAMKSPEEMMAEAKRAYESGAFRYCMVYSGRGPSVRRALRVAGIVEEIKSKYPIQVCVSAGLMGEEQTAILKKAGVDRLNHNLNTSEQFYPEVCTSHTFADRLSTLKAAKKVGLEVCSGMIIGMGEKPEDLVSVANELRSIDAKSVPINFLVPIDGNVLSDPKGLSPEYCLRVLCLFRFLLPKAELRAGAGREGHLRDMEAMSLYPANSLFLDGYLNARGGNRRRVLQMIKDAGFTIKSDYKLEDVLAAEAKAEAEQEAQGEGASSCSTGESFGVDGSAAVLKTLDELRPTVSTS